MCERADIEDPTRRLDAAPFDREAVGIETKGPHAVHGLDKGWKRPVIKRGLGPLGIDRGSVEGLEFGQPGEDL
jgi:hypothetical protein